jgi:toxin ParE1/3/4
VAPLKIRITQTAMGRLRDILGFVAQDIPDAADKLSERIEHGLERLAVFPASGRKIPESPERPERELVVAPCVRVFCRVEDGALVVLYAMRAEQAFDPETLNE